MYSYSEHNTSSSPVTLPLTHTLNEGGSETEGELLSGNAYQICSRIRNSNSNDITKTYLMTRANKLQNCNHLHVNNGVKNNKYAKCYEPLCKGSYNNNNAFGESEEMQDMHNLEQNHSTAKSDSNHQKNDNSEVAINTNNFAKFVNNLYSKGVEEKQSASATHAQEHFSSMPERKESGVDLQDRIELSLSQTNANMTARTSSRSTHNSHAVTTIASTSSSSTSPSPSAVSSQFLPSTTLTTSQLLLVPRSTRNTTSSITHQSSTPHEELT